MGREPAWRLVRCDRQGWRRRIDEATHPSVYAPNDLLINLSLLSHQISAGTPATRNTHSEKRTGGHQKMRMVKSNHDLIMMMKTYQKQKYVNHVDRHKQYKSNISAQKKKINR